MLVYLFKEETSYGSTSIEVYTDKCDAVMRAKQLAHETARAAHSGVEDITEANNDAGYPCVIALSVELDNSWISFTIEERETK